MATLKACHHKLIITDELSEDIIWWKVVFANYNGVRILQPDGITYVSFVQSSPIGAGMQCNWDWYFIDWNVDLPIMFDTG